jgi:hypothetical protein
MPEPNKATLKSQLTAEVMGALSQRPDLRVIKVADGAPDNWSYLGEMLPFGEEVLDLWRGNADVPGTRRDVKRGTARCA